MTNYERIKGMTIEEMHTFLCNSIQTCKTCAYKNASKECKQYQCRNGKREWLNKEYEGS